MTASDFREALAKLRFLELPESINRADYTNIERIWMLDPFLGFLRLTDADQAKVWAEIGRDAPALIQVCQEEFAPLNSTVRGIPTIYYRLSNNVFAVWPTPVDGWAPR